MCQIIIGTDIAPRRARFIFVASTYSVRLTYMVVRTVCSNWHEFNLIPIVSQIYLGAPIVRIRAAGNLAAPARHERNTSELGA